MYRWLVAIFLVPSLLLVGWYFVEQHTKIGCSIGWIAGVNQ
jgi:hypothetical protein